MNKLKSTKKTATLLLAPLIFIGIPLVLPTFAQPIIKHQDHEPRQTIEKKTEENSNKTRLSDTGKSTLSLSPQSLPPSLTLLEGIGQTTVRPQSTSNEKADNNAKAITIKLKSSAQRKRNIFTKRVYGVQEPKSVQIKLTAGHFIDNSWLKPKQEPSAAQTPRIRLKTPDKREVKKSNKTIINTF